MRAFCNYQSSNDWEIWLLRICENMGSCTVLENINWQTLSGKQVGNMCPRFFFFFFLQLVGSYFPNHGWNPGLWQWKQRVLIARPPGIPLCSRFKDIYLFIQHAILKKYSTYICLQRFNYSHVYYSLSKRLEMTQTPINWGLVYYTIYTCQCLIPGLERSPGVGNGNPLQYSCLENPMDRGAWWATVHGVAKSRTRLSN